MLTVCVSANQSEIAAVLENDWQWARGGNFVWRDEEVFMPLRRLEEMSKDSSTMMLCEGWYMTFCGGKKTTSGSACWYWLGIFRRYYGQWMKLSIKTYFDGSAIVWNVCNAGNSVSHIARCVGVVCKQREERLFWSGSHCLKFGQCEGFDLLCKHFWLVLVLDDPPTIFIEYYTYCRPALEGNPGTWFNLKPPMWWLNMADV